MKTIKVILISLGGLIRLAVWLNWIITIMSGAFVLLWFYAFSPQSYASEFRSELPRSAEEIQEHIVDLFPDWDYYLKAKITKEEFDEFTEDLELEHNPIRGEATIPFRGPDWWKPKLSGFLYSRIYKDDSGYCSAVYEEGDVYLFVCKM